MAKSISEELLERRSRIITEAQDIARKGVSEGRDLTVEEQTGFDQRIAEAEALATRAAAIAKGEQEARDLEESFRNASGRGEGTEQRTGEESGFVKWARDSRAGDSFVVDTVPGAERRAYGTWLGGHESRAMSATGGVGPDGVYGLLWEYAVATSQILQAGAEVISTSDGNTIPLPVVTAHATNASAAASAPITASDAVLTTVNLGANKRGYITLVPTELLQDAAFDLEGYLARAAGRELGRAVSNIAASAVTGGYVSGAVGPTGQSGWVGSQVSADQGGDLLITLFHSVLPDYRANSSWLMNDSTAARVRKLKDSQGQYVWERALQVGDPALIEGRPIYYDPFLPAVATSARSIFFGDFSSLKVRIAGGIRFERSNEYAFGNDQVAFRALVRTDAAVVDPNAVKFYVGAAT